MTELERLVDRLCNDPKRKLLNFHVTRGESDCTAEELAAEINRALDQVDNGTTVRGLPETGLRQRHVSEVVAEAEAQSKAFLAGQPHHDSKGIRRLCVEREDAMAKATKKSVRDRALSWIVGSNTGASSEAIWAHMMGAGQPKWGWSYPHDPDDLSRCLRLLRFIPEWRKRLPEMARHGKVWRTLVKNWAVVEQSMEDEVGWDWSKGRSAPKTYELMKGLGT